MTKIEFYKNENDEKWIAMDKHMEVIATIEPYSRNDFAEVSDGWIVLWMEGTGNFTQTLRGAKELIRANAPL